MNAEQFIKENNLLTRTEFTENELKSIFDKAIDQFMISLDEAPYENEINKNINELTFIKDKMIEIGIHNGFHLEIEN